MDSNEIPTAGETAPRYSRWDLALYVLRLGMLGFGGPVALAGCLDRDVVGQRNGISETDCNGGLTLTQLMPGPLAAQLAIYLGFVRQGCGSSRTSCCVGSHDVGAYSTMNCSQFQVRRL